MTASAPELAGILIAAIAAAVALTSRDRRLGLVAIGIALAAAPVLVLGSVWDEPRIEEFRGSPAQVGAAVIAGPLAVGLLAAAFRRFPGAFAVTALAVVPLRVPVEIGDETANLLVPLYAVIAAQVVVAALELRGRAGDREPGTERWWRADRPEGWLRWLLAATLLLYAVQSAYSDDVSNAIENLGFFLVPFSVLFVLLAEVEWTRALLAKALVAVAGVAGVCALVAIYQYAVGDLFLNPELLDANQLHVYFRVNSVFFDPNILGRYLALALTTLGAYLAWSDDRRGVALACATAALLLAGLAFSYSITSFAALLAGLGMVALLRFGWRGALGAGALGAAGLVALALAGGTPTSDIQSDRSIDSGRSSLIEGGFDLADDHPLTGHGSGSFGAAFVAEIDPQARSAVSHSEPITVAAEQGIGALIVYAALLAVSLVVVLGAGAGRSAARTAVGACYVAMIVHSLGYAGFVIDPATWALLALGVALRPGPEAGVAAGPSGRPGPPAEAATMSA